MGTSQFVLSKLSQICRASGLRERHFAQAAGLQVVRKGRPCGVWLGEWSWSQVMVRRAAGWHSGPELQSRAWQAWRGLPRLRTVPCGEFQSSSVWASGWPRRWDIGCITVGWVNKSGFLLPEKGDWGHWRGKTRTSPVVLEWNWGCQC